MNKAKRICVIIPAFNEEGSILKVINEIINTKIDLDVVVVNDGSIDNTQKVLDMIQNKTSVRVLSHPFNLGIGGAVQSGIKYAMEKNYDIAVQIDADGQHDPMFLRKLLTELKDFDMVIGSRYIKKTSYKTPPLRLLGIKLFSVLIKITCGKKVYDSTSGYRVFGPKAIAFFSSYYPQEFPEPRSIVSLLKNGYRIKEVPVETRQRSGGKSSISFLYAIYLMSSISISILFESFKDRNHE